MWYFSNQINILRNRKRFLSLTGLGIALFTIYFLLSTTPAFAQEPPKPTEYELLAPLPGIETSPGSGKATTATFIPGLFRLIIGIAGVLAVVMIIYGGIKYMSTDAFGGKSEAKGIIENALWGLILAVSAWLILVTINPNLVNFDLNIPVQKIADTTIPGGGGGGGSTGCQGNCPFSYVNSSGVTVRYRECSSCSNASSFGLSIKPSIQIVNATQAQINTDLGNKLKAMRNTSGNPAFQVTEAYPPTVNHASQEQYDGTAVDVSLQTKTAANIATFANNARAQGLRAEYEVRTSAERDDYIDAGLPFGVTIKVVPYITGEHFSVYKN